jgi:hypothetical protein
MKLVILLKMCFSETYGKVWIGKHLPGIIFIYTDLEQRDALLPLHFNCALEHAIWKVQVNQDRLKLNVTWQCLIYADYVNLPDGNIYTTKKNTEHPVVTIKEVCLVEINVEKSK